jgi:prepilin-type N-terminal cleavage/methylation domain-containing protein
MKMGDKRKIKGFTLIELLFTIALLVVVIMAILGLYDVGTRTFRQQSAQIVAENELRDAMDIILMECRRGRSYSNADHSITCSDHKDTFRVDGTVLKMIQTDTDTLDTTEVILGYDVSSISFDVGAQNIEIKIYSTVKDAKGDIIFVEAVYYMR